MARVLNVKTADPHDCIGAVPIWRGTKFGNPFRMNNITRRDAIERFERYLNEHPELIEAARVELRGKNLLCYCSPRHCHGDVLLKIANSPTHHQPTTE